MRVHLHHSSRMNVGQMTSSEEIRRPIRNRGLGNSSKSKSRPLVNQRHPVDSLSSSKSRRTHVNISQPMLFQPNLSPRVNFSNPAPTHCPSTLTPISVVPNQLQFSQDPSSGNDPKTSEDNVMDVTNNRMSSRQGHSSFKRSASESELLSVKDLPLDSPFTETNKRIRIDNPHPKSVNDFTSSQSEFALSSRKSPTPQEYTLKFAAPTPFSSQQSKSSALDLTCAHSFLVQNSIGFTTLPSQGVPFTFAPPTPVDPFNGNATQSLPVDFTPPKSNSPQGPSKSLNRLEAVKRKRSDVTSVQNEAIINSGDAKQPSLVDKPNSAQRLCKKVIFSPIRLQADTSLPSPTHFPCPSTCSPGGSVSELDEAFLRTPYVGMESPNLLDKINSEIAQRSDFSSGQRIHRSSTWFSNCTPVVPVKLCRESLQHVNESYKKAVLGSNAYSERFQKGPTALNLSKKVPTAVWEETDVASEGKLSVDDSDNANESYNVTCPPVALQFNSSSTIEEDKQSVATVSPASQHEQLSTTCTVSASEQLPISNNKNTQLTTQAPTFNDDSCTPLSWEVSATQSTSTVDQERSDSSDSNYKVKGTPNSDPTEIKTKDHLAGARRFVTSPTSKNRHAVHSNKLPAVRQGTKMKATSNALMKRRYAYSATLGIDDSLVHPRTRCGQKVMSPSKIAPRYCSPASLSASLGITTLGGEGRRYASRHSCSNQHIQPETENDYSPEERSVQNKHTPRDFMKSVQVESHWWTSHDHIDSTPNEISTLPMDATRDEQRLMESTESVVSVDCASPSSPAPTLLKIVESNVAQSQKKQAGE